MRALVAALLLTAVALVLAPNAAPSAGAQAPTTTIVPLPDGGAQGPTIIPLPNSGRQPVVDGDPGSGAQYAVLAATVGGLLAVGLLVARESKRKRGNRTPAPGPAVRTDAAPEREPSR